MTHIITLVSSDNNLTVAHFNKVADFLKLYRNEEVWLAKDKAGEFEARNVLSIGEMKALRGILEEDKVDIFCTPIENRRKKLLLADMDSTIVTSETLDELADEAGIKDKISAITERAMRGELDFFEAIRERVGLLAGLPSNALTRTLEQTEISIGAQPFVQTMRQHGAFCGLVSGGFTFFTEHIAAQLGFNVHHGNQLEISNEALTGKVIEPILDKETKLSYLKEYANKQDISLDETMAIGDGANDLPMLEATGLGIGYHPKPLLEERLLNCIRHTDLTSALYAQGYRNEDFAV